MSVVAAVVLAATVGSWSGGGDLLYPGRDRYEPGQEVTVIGYTSNGDTTWRTAGPMYAWLSPVARGAHLRLGPAEVLDRPELDPGRPVRVGATFRLPADLPPGAYWVEVCNADCNAHVGWLMGGNVYVGVPPSHPVVREWPLTEPAIRWLEDGALLLGPEARLLTAADVRAGRTDAGIPLLPTPTATERPTRVTAPPAPEPAPAPARSTANPDRRGGEPVVPWLVAGVAVLAVWCWAWRLGPRITVR
jgi:hypothetical protein